VVGLLSAASGAKKLVIGNQAVKQELALGHVKLLVVATDARAAIASREIEGAIGSGLAVAWGTKAELGAATHRNETGVVGVLDSGFARALRRVAELSLTPDPNVRFSTSGESSTEE
jgi:ribosomal protein L7Ae-like RNA K-turn-binding protein